MCGNSAKSWKTRPIERCSGGRNTDGPAISRPLSSTRPVVCGSMPAAIRSSVVLPEPEDRAGRAPRPARPQRDVVAASRRAGREGMADVLESQPRGEGDARRAASVLPARPASSACSSTFRCRLAVPTVNHPSPLGVNRPSSSRSMSVSGSSSSVSSSGSAAAPASRIGRHARGEQAGALQLLDARQVADLLQAEMIEEGVGRAVGHRTAGRAAAAAHAHPFGLQQRVERALGGLDAADVLDLGAGHRLVVGDDRQHFERGARQLLLLHRVAASSGRRGRRRCGTPRRRRRCTRLTPRLA